MSSASKMVAAVSAVFLDPKQNEDVVRKGRLILELWDPTPIRCADADVLPVKSTTTNIVVATCSKTCTVKV